MGFHFDGNIILFMEEIIFKLFNLPLLSLGILGYMAAVFTDCWEVAACLSFHCHHRPTFGEGEGSSLPQRRLFPEIILEYLCFPK